MFVLDCGENISEILTFHFILIIKPTRCTNFSNLLWHETLHVSDSSSVHHQESFSVGTAMVYVIQVMLTACELDQDGTADGTAIPS
jgi:UDP-N-acetylglucosamine 2-epimerase